MINKVVLGVVGGGILTSVGVGSAFYFTQSKEQTYISITNLLEEENKYTLLSTTSDTEGWNTAWNEYQKDNNNQEDGQDKWKVEGWKKTGVNTTPAGFKTVCTDKKDGKAKDTKDPQYTDFVKYCTRPKTMEEALKKFNFVLLKDDSQNTKWKSKFEEYKKADNQLPDAKVSKDNSSSTFEKLKNGCTEALKLKTNDPKYATTVKAVKFWCKQ